MKVPESWNMFYIGSEIDIILALEQINSNCGFPDAFSQTWAEIEKAWEQDFWFFQVPPPWGYTEVGAGGRSFTQEEMIFGVINVAMEPSQPNWWPVIPPLNNKIT